MGRLKGKVAIVTGAGSIGPGWGNGKATAVLYAREGARVVLVDRHKDAVSETEEIIKSENGRCVSVVADVSTRDGVDSYVEEAVAAFGGIDILHNNVGIGVPGELVELSEKTWDLVYRVNVKSVFLGCQRAIPEMRKRGAGAIVNISSVASIRWNGVPFSAYSSSKAAVNQLTQAIALEYAPDNIRCNTVIIGYVNTPTVTAAYEKTDWTAVGERGANQTRASSVPLGRTGTAWDIAHASLFLASDEAQFITGTQLIVDGGLTAVCDR